VFVQKLVINMIPNCVLPGYGLAIIPTTYIADRQLFTATNTAAVKQLESGLNCTSPYNWYWHTGGWYTHNWYTGFVAKIYKLTARP